VQVLVVRNTNLAHSNLSGLDYGNAMAVAEALTQLNVEFDLVMDRDLVYVGGNGRHAVPGARFKTDLSAYRLVILPSVAIDFPDPVWQTLDAWLSDPAPAGKRVLALGWIGKRGPRLQPREAFHPTLQKWLGCSDYSGTASLQGKQSLVLSDGNQARDLEVDFGHIPPTGLFTQGQPLVVRHESAVPLVVRHESAVPLVVRHESAVPPREGQTLATRINYHGSAVYAFGFPLGFAHEPLWGLAPEQQPRDAVVPLYEALAKAAKLDRPILAPHNLRVYVSQGGQMILIRERAGLKTEAEVAVRVPQGIQYPGLTLRRGQDGYTRFRVTLEPWEGRWWKAEGRTSKTDYHLGRGLKLEQEHGGPRG
jgi:hypothetical protein